MMDRDWVEKMGELADREASVRFDQGFILGWMASPAFSGDNESLAFQALKRVRAEVGLPPAQPFVLPAGGEGSE